MFPSEVLVARDSAEAAPAREPVEVEDSVPREVPVAVVAPAKTSAADSELTSVPSVAAVAADSSTFAAEVDSELPSPVAS